MKDEIKRGMKFFEGDKWKFRQHLIDIIESHTGTLESLRVDLMTTEDLLRLTTTLCKGYEYLYK